jgi:predicted nucleic-acid-binding protein
VKRPAVRVPDTNAIVRYLLGDHPTLSPRAEEFFSHVRTGEQKVLILESVIAETIYVLTKAYGVPRDKAASGLMGLLNYRGISNPDRAALMDALALFNGGKLDIVDCLVIAKSRHGHAEPLTFDRELMKEFDSKHNPEKGKL